MHLIRIQHLSFSHGYGCFITESQLAGLPVYCTISKVSLPSTIQNLELNMILNLEKKRKTSNRRWKSLNVLTKSTIRTPEKANFHIFLLTDP